MPIRHLIGSKKIRTIELKQIKDTTSKERLDIIYNIRFNFNGNLFLSLQF